ncbi:branched-chain amino acid ABC transporter ATP-binding protein/permease [Phytohabitans sp. ZYX-F-186]|uniref:Branched-chain amino acid ABC transporter ATP-binding protein/permease n=1 Tax=Phytohabitans maris TaxID=3071409 RepID=A0ABU0ZD10_9ACTN|nr:branched-chain amino acid ABC transporter ATP-binding protein/permease [Phytohabitans sp. ZYX-F-186]MDQ7903817.1 branched-chain amino acid ABC transporter ATP-binding protein/permease [Phytohabitans sp. ZYX-F-186]
MTRRFAIGFPLVVAVLACLSLYRVTLGFPLFYLALLTLMLFWVTQATSWNILSGYSGYFSFGQAAYVGIGAYSTAVLFGRHGVNFYVTILVAAGLSAVLALAVGAIAFRLRSLRGEIFALLTLAVPFILAALARINSSIDGGQGIIVSVPPFPAGLGLFQDFLYLLNLLVAAVAVLVAYLMRKSRFGWALAGVRDAEDVAEGLGVPTFRYKMLALLASAVIGGVGGSLFALQIGFVAVDSIFHLTVPLFVIVMSVLGGRTHWLGPVVGVVLVVLLQDRLTASGLGEWQLIVLGAVLVLLVLLAPEGVYARLRARPLVALVTAAVVAAAVWLPGEPLDAILVGLLAATAVALLPLRAAPPAPVVAEPAEQAAPAPVAPPAEPVGVGEVLVECRNVARYFGGVRALEDVSLTVREGEIVGLVGPNGSGKTTLVGLLSGSLRPTRGSIHVAGNDLAKLPPHRVAHAGVARTYQIPRPFTSMTVRDNVAMAIMFGRSPRSLATARRDAAGPLDVVGLGHLADAYPDKLNLHQRQLLEIARALAADPKVLLLDEALAGLNPAEIDNAVEVIRRVHRSGVSIVIVEHLLRVVNQLATRIVVLDRGTRLADGDPREVLTDPAVVRAYLGKRAHA